MCRKFIFTTHSKYSLIHNFFTFAFQNTGKFLQLYLQTGKERSGQ